MRNVILIATFLLLVSGICVADDAAISQIRQEYESIRKALPGLKAETLGLPTDGSATAYRDRGGNIRLIRVERFFESGKVSEEYYYKNGALIFSFYRRHRYNLPYHVTPESAKQSGVEPFDPKKSVITEDRYYFDKGKMIRWLNDKRIFVKSNSKEFALAEQEVTTTSNETLAEFNRKS